MNRGRFARTGRTDLSEIASGIHKHSFKIYCLSCGHNIPDCTTTYIRNVYYAHDPIRPRPTSSAMKTVVASWIGSDIAHRLPSCVGRATSHGIDNFNAPYRQRRIVSENWSHCQACIPCRLARTAQLVPPIVFITPRVTYAGALLNRHLQSQHAWRAGKSKEKR